MKKMICICIAFASIINMANSQSIAGATIGSVGGKFTNGNYTLQFTLGETIVSNQNSGNRQLTTGFWSVVPASYSSSAATIYTFTGNGNFSVAANWQGGVVPPDPLPANAEIVIAPAAVEGQCILNIPYHISPGGKFSVIAGKRLIISGLLNIQ